MTPSVNGAQPVESTPQAPGSTSPALPLQSAEPTPPPAQGEGGIPVSQAPSVPIGVDSVRHPQGSPQDVAGISFFHQVDPTGRPVPVEAVDSGEAAIPNQNVFNEKQHTPGIAPIISAPPVPLAAAPQPVTSPTPSGEQPDLLQLEAPSSIATEEPKLLAPQPTEAPTATPQSPKKPEEEKPVIKTSYTSPDEAKKAGEVVDWHQEPAPEPKASDIAKAEVPPKEAKSESLGAKLEAKAQKLVAKRRESNEPVKSEPQPIKKVERPKYLSAKAVLAMQAGQLESVIGADHTGINA